MTICTKYNSGISVGRYGFSMVEVALAILVLGIGLMAVVGLISGGMETSKNTVSGTQVAQFANDVMDGVRYVASISTNSSAFSDQMQGKIGSSLPPVAKDLWDSATQARTLSVGNWDTFVYSYSNNVDFACRYRLQLFPSPTGRSVDVQLDVASGLNYTQTFYTSVYKFVR